MTDCNESKIHPLRQMNRGNDDTTFDHSEVANGTKKNRILKRPYRIGDKIIIVLEEALIKKLKIDEETIWFEQIAQENGILLKTTKLSDLTQTGNLKVLSSVQKGITGHTPKLGDIN